MKSKELAEAHWKYVESVLVQHNVSDWERAIAKHHYIAAFVHGYKHAEEENLLWL